MYIYILGAHFPAKPKMSAQHIPLATIYLVGVISNTSDLVMTDRQIVGNDIILTIHRFSALVILRFWWFVLSCSIVFCVLSLVMRESGKEIIQFMTHPKRFEKQNKASVKQRGGGARSAPPALDFLIDGLI